MSSDRSPIENTSVLDAFAYHRQLDHVKLEMIETRPWDDSPERLAQLQAKINTYLSFVVDWQLAKTYPQYAGKPVVIELYCYQLPEGTISEFLEQVWKALAQYKIQFVIKVVRPQMDRKAKSD